MRKRIVVKLAIITIVGVAALTAKNRYLGALPLRTTAYNAPSAMATWPLQSAQTETLRPGVTHSLAVDSDGTQIDFFDFNFAQNTRLRWEIFDQDEDDVQPFDNHVLYWNRNVARATKELNATGRGPVLAAWNGAFYGYNPEFHKDAFHVAPIVLRGKVHFNSGTHRWTFGIKNTPTGPVWKVFFKPDKVTLQKEYDYAAGSVQCLIKDGKPLKVEPFPAVGGAFKAQPVPSSAQEAGHIPKFDHMKTCRASIAWSRDNKHLYLLTVKEPDSEAASTAALTMAVNGMDPSLGGGWTVADVQHFWQSKGVWGAINSDAGSVMQMVFRHPDNHYTFVPPRQASGITRIETGTNWNGALRGGGAMMYFLVREQ